MTKKQQTIIVLLLFFSGLCMLICFFGITEHNEFMLKNRFYFKNNNTPSDLMGLYFYTKNFFGLKGNGFTQFNYFNGLWLMFMGIMMFCFFSIFSCKKLSK